MNWKFQILFLLTNFFLTSCAQNIDNKEPEKKETLQTVNSPPVTDYSSIKLIDKFHNALAKDTTFEKTESQFSPVYIGVKNAELNLTYKTVNIGNRNEIRNKYKRPNLKSLKITIDTSRTIGSPMGIWEYYNQPEYRNGKIAFPVFIENVSTDTLNIGLGNILPIIIEAKDKEGNWKPIQIRFIYDCGTGLTEFYLAPSQIAITTMKIFAGDFNTKLRLVFGYSEDKVYSNEIDGQINLGQFE